VNKLSFSLKKNTRFKLFKIKKVKIIKGLIEVKTFKSVKNNFLKISKNLIQN